MIELISVVDWFNVILGSWVVHLAAFLTLILCFAGRLPKYEGDPDRTKQATIMYTLLVFLHLVLAVVKFISLYHHTYFNNKMTIFIMIMVFMTCELCQNWVFDRGEDINTLTEDQIKFERWLWIELQFIISFIFGGIFFLLCSKIKRPVLSERAFYILNIFSTSNLFVSTAVLHVKSIDLPIHLDPSWHRKLYLSDLS